MRRNFSFFIVAVLLIMGLLLVACGGAQEDTPAGDTPAPEQEEPTPEAEEPTPEAEEPTPEAEEPTPEAEETPTEEGAAEEGEGEAATDDGAAAEEEAAPTAAPVEGGLLIWADEQRAPILEEIGQQFSDEFGVPVVVQQLAFDQVRDQFKLAAPAGEGPDIIVGAHDWLGELVINGLLAEVDLMPVQDQFDQNAIDAFTYQGALYGMPMNTENVAFFYNTDLVSEPPETWEDFMSTCADLHEGGEVEQCFALMHPDPYHFFPIQSAFGGGVFGQTEDGSWNPDEVLIDSEGSIQAAQLLGQMAEQGYVGPDVDWEGAHALFEGGQSAFIITGPWALERLDESGVPYGIAPIPAATEPGKPFLGSHGFMISQFSNEPLLAQTFLTEFVATQEVMQQFADETNRPSAFLPVLEQQQSDERLSAFSTAGESGVPMPAIPEMASVWSAWGDAITLIIQGQEEPQPAFENAAEQIRSAIGQEQ